MNASEKPILPHPRSVKKGVARENEIPINKGYAWRVGTHGSIVYPTAPERAKVNEAVRQMGTNAIPTLLCLVRARDSTLKTKFMDLVYRQHIINIKYTGALFWRYSAMVAFSQLGTNAQSAVPALIQTANQNNPFDSRLCAIQSLDVIGPSAKEAVPSLLRWATNANDRLCFDAARAIRNIDPEAAAKAGMTNFGWDLNFFQ